MITVKLFGLLRLDTGLREVTLEAAHVRQLKQLLPQACGVSAERLRGCVLLVNGQPAKDRTPLKNGDIVSLLSPVAGG